MTTSGSLSALEDQLFFTYALLAAGTFSTFYLPAVLLQQREPYNEYFPTENKFNYVFYVLAIAILVAFGPMMELIGEWNANMTLPENLKGVEDWMRTQEDASNDVLKRSRWWTIWDYC